MLTLVFHCVSDKSEKCVSIVSGGTFGGGDVSISYTEILPSRECARATGERLPNRKPISISTISSTAPLPLLPSQVSTKLLSSQPALRGSSFTKVAR